MHKTQTTYTRVFLEEDVRDAPISKARIDNTLKMARKGGDDECVSDGASSSQRIGVAG